LVVSLPSEALPLAVSFDAAMPGAYPTDPAANTADARFGRLSAMSHDTDQPPVVAVVGPTAAGKTDLSLDLAEALGGEVVNTDSMQVYRGMDIGTAKLPVAERRGIPHHLLDLLEVTEPATVAEFQGWARAVIADCRRRGVTPVLVGGSALYTRAILDRFEFPGTDPEVRRRLEQELAEVGPEAMHRRLSEADPEAAARIIPTNGRRVVRALEVIAITGRPFSATLPELRYEIADAHQIGVDIPRPVLDERISQRVERMWEAGFVDEVRRLAERGLREGRTANRALGYQQVLAFLDGRITEEEAKAQTIAATRRFARRQDSWFRKDPRITWVAWDGPDRVAKALAAVRRPAAP
jgi:tRNA dimethylallyltransferase